MNQELNILIRTSNRPNYFEKCIESIVSQNYPNLNIFIAADTQEAISYATQILNKNETYFKSWEIVNILDYLQCEKTGCFWNLYLNILLSRVKGGYIHILDDDDAYAYPDFLQDISKHLTSENFIYLFRMRFPNGKIIPSNSRFNVDFFVRGDIGMPNFIFHSSKIGLVEFDGERAADFRYLQGLAEHLGKRWIDLVGIDVGNFGLIGEMKDIQKVPDIYYTVPFSLIKDFGKAYNQYMELLQNDDDWMCFMDGDIFFLNPDFGKHIADVIAMNPGGGIYTCLTNRIANPEQRINGKFINTPNILTHKKYADSRKKKYYSLVKQTHKRISGFLMVVQKKVWKEIKFTEGLGILGVDWDFSTRVLESGYPIYIMQGLYVFHYYRLHVGGVSAIDHLKLTENELRAIRV